MRYWHRPGELPHARRVGQLLAERAQDAQRLALAVVGERVGRRHEGPEGTARRCGRRACPVPAARRRARACGAAAPERSDGRCGWASASSCRSGRCPHRAQGRTAAGAAGRLAGVARAPAPPLTGVLVAAIDGVGTEALAPLGCVVTITPRVVATASAVPPAVAPRARRDDPDRRRTGPDPPGALTAARGAATTGRCLPGTAAAGRAATARRAVGAAATRSTGTGTAAARSAGAGAT